VADWELVSSFQKGLPLPRVHLLQPGPPQVLEQGPKTGSCTPGWWDMPAIPAPERPRLENGEFEPGLSYTVRSRPQENKTNSKPRVTWKASPSVALGPHAGKKGKPSPSLSST
jgi:hypothetical protein